MWPIGHGGVGIECDMDATRSPVIVEIGKWMRPWIGVRLSDGAPVTYNEGVVGYVEGHSTFLANKGAGIVNGEHLINTIQFDDVSHEGIAYLGVGV